MVFLLNFMNVYYVASINQNKAKQNYQNIVTWGLITQPTFA